MCVTFKEELAEDNRKRLTLTANTYVFSNFFLELLKSRRRRLYFGLDGAQPTFSNGAIFKA